MGEIGDRLERGLEDLGYERDIPVLFDGADQFQILNRLIAIEQRINSLTELAAGYLQEKGEQVIK